MNNFVPLRVVSCYSFLQSGLTMERIASGVSKNEYFGVGLCDKGVMYGVPSFIKTMEAIKKLTIIGIEAHIDNDTLCLYAINETGYRHLLIISSAIQKNEFDKKLLVANTEGLLAVLDTNSDNFKTSFTNEDELTNILMIALLSHK